MFLGIWWGEKQETRDKYAFGVVKVAQIQPANDSGLQHLIQMPTKEMHVQKMCVCFFHQFEFAYYLNQ